MLRPSKRLIYTDVRQTGPLVINRPHELLIPHPRMSILRGSAYAPKRIFLPVRDI
jgi:hypothetical protein